MTGLAPFFLFYYFLFIYYNFLKFIFPFILSFFFFKKKGLGWDGLGLVAAGGGGGETNISKYVNSFLSTNPTTLILSSIVSEF